MTSSPVRFHYITRFPVYGVHFADIPFGSSAPSEAVRKPEAQGAEFESGWTSSISQHLETMVETMTFVGICMGIIIPGCLRV